MNDSKSSSNGLLVLRIPKHIGMEAVAKITQNITPLAEEMGLEPMVLDGGADASVSVDYTSLLTRLCVAVEGLVAQGAEPDAGSPNVAENAPQALNARPSGLNSRPTSFEDIHQHTSAVRAHIEQHGMHVQPDKPWPRS